jgi:outer membrane protein OmpA-like peptidoglycan-associated protein
MGYQRKIYQNIKPKILLNTIYSENIMKKIYLLIVCLSLYSLAVGQKTKKADRLYENWQYAKALEHYKKAAEKNPGPDIHFKLGETYRLMNNDRLNQQDAYDKVNREGLYSNHLFYLHYGEVLRNNGNNVQAKESFLRYSVLVPGDMRGKYFAEAIDIVQEDHQWDEPIAIQNVSSINSSAADLSPILYKEGIVFASNRKGSSSKKYAWTGGYYLDLYYARRGFNETSFGSVESFGGKHINKKFHDGPATFSSKFDTMYFARVERYLTPSEKKTQNVEHIKIFESIYQDEKWSKATSISLSCDTYSISNPFLSKDGSRLFFVSDMAGGMGETDIYYSDRIGNTWSTPRNMGSNINTFNREKYPRLDSAGNFYFSSDGYQGYGGTDICVALKNGDTWNKANPLKYPFNSSGDDNGIVFTQYGKAGYFSSDRKGNGSGSDDIYSFNLSNDKIDPKMLVSDYIIGYRPAKPVVKELPVAAIIEEKPSTPPTIAPVPVAEVFPDKLSIYFDFDKYEIRSDAISSLNKVGDFMKKNPTTQLELGGHCDSHGTSQYNVVLSILRNEAVIKYLSDYGVDKKKISGVGYGFSQLVNNCIKGVICTKPEEQLNRRVEMDLGTTPNREVMR